MELIFEINVAQTGDSPRKTVIDHPAEQGSELKSVGGAFVGSDSSDGVAVVGQREDVEVRR